MLSFLDNVHLFSVREGQSFTSGILHYLRDNGALSIHCSENYSHGPYNGNYPLTSGSIISILLEKDMSLMNFSVCVRAHHAHTHMHLFYMYVVGTCAHRMHVDIRN